MKLVKSFNRKREEAGRTRQRSGQTATQAHRNKKGRTLCHLSDVCRLGCVGTD